MGRSSRRQVPPAQIHPEKEVEGLEELLTVLGGYNAVLGWLEWRVHKVEVLSRLRVHVDGQNLSLGSRTLPYRASNCD